MLQAQASFLADLESKLAMIELPSITIYKLHADLTASISLIKLNYATLLIFRKCSMDMFNS